MRHLLQRIIVFLASMVLAVLLVLLIIRWFLRGKTNA